VFECDSVGTEGKRGWCVILTALLIRMLAGGT